MVALRGDVPKDGAVRPAEERDFAYASDLVRFARPRGGLRLAVAAYPEKHPESPSADEDLRRFVEKAAAGADWAITQLFFDARDYFAFVGRARQAGAALPIVPGIMPVTGYAQLKRFTGLCGTTVPPELDERLAVGAGRRRGGGGHRRRTGPRASAVCCSRAAPRAPTSTPQPLAFDRGDSRAPSPRMNAAAPPAARRHPPAPTSPPPV